MSILHTSTYAATGSATVHTCPISPTPVAGRKLVAMFAKGATESSHSAGWTKVASGTDLNAVELDTYERWSDGTETQFAVTLSAAATACGAVFENSGLQNASADTAATFTPTVSYANAVLADAPIGFWQIQEGVGATIALDSVGSPHNGTYVGGTTSGVTGPLVDRSFATVFANGYVNIANNATVELDTATDMTIEFAVKPTTTPGTFKHIFSMYGGTGVTGYWVSTGGSGGLKFSIGSGGAEVFHELTGYVWDTNWHHFVFALDTTSLPGTSILNIWDNGVNIYGGPLSSASTIYPVAGTAGDPLRFMDWSQDTNFSLAFPGTGAFAALYNFGLSATRVAAHYAIFGSGTPTSSPNTGTTAVVSSAGDALFAAFAYQSLTDDTVSGYSGSFASVAHLISTNGTGTKTHLDVAVQTAGGVATQSATITYGSAQTRRSANIAAFLPASSTGSGAIYPLFKQSRLSHSPFTLDIGSATFKAAIGRIADGFAYDPTSQWFSDVSATLVSSYSTAVTIPNVTAPLGVVTPGAPHIQFPISTGAPLDFMVFFLDGGSAGASPLVAYVPLVAPVTPVSGQVVQVDFDTGTHVLAGLFAI